MQDQGLETFSSVDLNDFLELTDPTDPEFISDVIVQGTLNMKSTHNAQHALLNSVLK